MARLFSRIIVACGAMWIAVTSAHAGDDHFAPIGSEFMANQYTPYTQGQPTVAMDHDGNFVVAFSNLGDIWARMFWADGTPRTNDFWVNEGLTYGSQDRPIASMAEDGTFVIVWQDWNGNDGDEMGAAGRVFNADGTPRTPPMILNHSWQASQFDVSVAMANDHTFVATFTDAGRDGIAGIFARRFNGDGVPLTDDFLVNDPSDRSQVTSEISMDANGAFVIAWTDAAAKYGEPRNVVAKMFEADTTPRTGEIPLTSDGAGFQRWPVVAMAGWGGWVAAWQDESALDGSGMGVWARFFAPNGLPTTPVFLVNQTTIWDQNNPAVAMDWQGNCLIVWDDNSTGSLEAKARRYAADGHPVTDEFQLNTITTGDQFLSTVAVDSYGERFVTGWLGNGDVWVRRYETQPLRAQRFNDDGQRWTQITLALNGNKPGWPYILAASTGTNLGVPLPNGRKWDLNPDALFFESLNHPFGPVFRNFQGYLDANSEGYAAVYYQLGASKAGGFEIAVSAITFEPSGYGLRTVTRPIRVPMVW